VEIGCVVVVVVRRSATGILLDVVSSAIFTGSSCFIAASLVVISNVLIVEGEGYVGSLEVSTSMVAVKSVV
jgi:hypothetical protein